ncbi:hypothetical protein PoB_006072500 [Plakobranchus ocellatus]|uniref:Uncharacterized protein n=1 Tax=Plakobranchus ocellatus TaxID=259542 RepID=A0AAV4CQW9_9GAST|nr:hypothetical protein PoB_006072500 [Plakobranchus ocellatus]
MVIKFEEDDGDHEDDYDNDDGGGFGGCGHGDVAEDDDNDNDVSNHGIREKRKYYSVEKEVGWGKDEQAKQGQRKLEEIEGPVDPFSFVFAGTNERRRQKKENTPDKWQSTCLISFRNGLLTSGNQFPVDSLHTNSFNPCYRINNSSRPDTFIGCSLDGAQKGRVRCDL